jgi:Fe2+ or Zn2+ uptake regulation protein
VNKVIVMRKINREKANVTQEDVINVMSKKEVGAYTIDKILNFMLASGYELSKAAIRNHLGKLELLGFINKVKASGLVAFEFLDSTASSFNEHEKIRLEELAVTRGSMRRRVSAECKDGSITWGKRIDGVRVAMKGVGTAKMIGV